MAQEDAGPWTYDRVFTALADLRRRTPDRVVLFGTSTTAQHNGYSAALAARFGEHWTARCDVLGYGGMGISLAGLANLPQVLALQPQWVLIDFTTGVMGPDFGSLVDRITVELVRAGMLPVWVAYPMFRPDGGFDERRSERVASLLAYGEATGAPVIDAFHAFRERDKALFRDFVHPLEAGVDAVCAHVWGATLEIAREPPPPRRPERFSGFKAPRRPVDPYAPLHYTPIEALELSGGLARDDEGYAIVPAGKVIEIQAAGVVHSAQMRIGPYSPILDVSGEGGASAELTVWDEWCHFERPMLIPLSHLIASLNPGVAQTWRIGFSPRRPDYAKARRPVSPEGAPQALKLKGFHHQAPWLAARLADEVG